MKIFMIIDDTLIPIGDLSSKETQELCKHALIDWKKERKCFSLKLPISSPISWTNFLENLATKTSITQRQRKILQELPHTVSVEIRKVPEEGDSYGHDQTHSRHI